MQTQATTMPLGSMPVPMPTGSLEAYVQTVNRFPMLSAEEERALAQRFRAEGDLEAARAMVLSHLRLVVAVARGYLGYGLPHADLIHDFFQAEDGIRDYKVTGVQTCALPI